MTRGVHSALPSPIPSSSRAGLTEPHSRGSSAGSPTEWFSFSPLLPSPSPDAQEKGKAIDRGLSAELWRHLAHTRSFDVSAKRAEDLEGGARKAYGLGMGLAGASTTETSPLATRIKASPQLSGAAWRPPNPLSVLTRRRVSPASDLPIASPMTVRSVSTESSVSSTSSASSASPIFNSFSVRLQRASRPHRSKRKRDTIETTARFACGCACLMLIFLVLRSGSVTAGPWRVLQGGGSLTRPPRAARSAPILGGRPSQSWQRRKPVAPERDTLVLYRILGNDLPPRHTHGQTLRNVRFMLQHEHEFDHMVPPISRIEKYYVLNRIASEDTVLALLTLFQEFEVPQDRILYLPFEWEKYAETSLIWQGGVADYPAIWNMDRPDYSPDSPFEATNATGELTPERLARQDTMGRLRAIDFTYHDKNQYAINNNGGRNFALSHGRTLSHARWILPLDGNCFFTPSAMQALMLEMASSADAADAPRYLVIPMTRLLDNDVVLLTNHHVDERTPPSLPPDAPEEPQIGFRYDAVDSFQSVMRYGRRSKLELLWRLGAVPQSRDLHKRTLPWESTDRRILTAESYGSIRSSKAQQGYISAGWVFRLFSGDSRQELFSPEASVLRNMNRVKGIVAFLERLDEIITRGKQCPSNEPLCGFTKDRFWAFSAEALFQLATDYRLGGEKERTGPLLDLAENARVAFDTRLKLGNVGHCAAEEASRNATSLALAGYITGNATLTHAAAMLLRLRFFGDDAAPRPAVPLGELSDRDGTGFMFPFPATTYDQPQWLFAPRPSHQWSADFDATQLLDALRLLSHTHLPRVLRKAVRDVLPTERLHAAVSAHLARLLSQTGEQKTLEDGAKYDLQVAALASAVDDVRLLRRVAARAPLRYRKGEEPMLAHRWLAEGLQRVRCATATLDVDGRTLQSSRRDMTQLQSYGDEFAALAL